MKSKIAKKLIVYTILFSSAITLITTTAQFYNEFQQDVKGISQRLEQIKSSYLESITQSVWLSDRHQLQLILDGITELPDVVYSEVQSEHGGDIKSGSTAQGDSIEFEQDLNYLYNNRNIHIGKFVVIASLSGVYNRLLNRLWIILLSNALKTSLVAIFIYFLFAKLVTRHLSRISEFALSDTTSTLNMPLVLDRAAKKEDEFDVVVSSINQLRRGLHDHIEELDQQKLYLSQTLHSIGDAVITTDIEGNVTRMNPVAEKLTGWSIEEAKGQPVKNIFPIVDASTRESIKNTIDKVMAAGKVVYLSNHTTLISRDGTEYQIADSAAPIRDEGRILGMVLVFSDVTAEYKLRMAAAKNKRDLQVIMDNFPAVVYVKDTGGCYTFINRRFENLFHIGREDIVGKTDYDIFPKDTADKFRQNDKAVLKAGYAREIEEVTPHDDGYHTYVSIKFPLFDGKDTIYAICGISTDITERRKQEDQLRQAQKLDALGKLTGGIAHDYNNMLGVILGYAEILERELGEQSELAAYVNKIRHAGERGSQLTQKLLSFSKYKASDEGLLDINTLLLEDKLMLEKTQTARIRLVLDLEENLWPVWLDSGDLEDAILNISINAMHAMGAGGQLTIKTANEQVNAHNARILQITAGDYALLSIIDTGCGMDEVTKRRIFDPFYTTKGEHGTGLGLSQVYGLVERSGGAITVNSEPGHGTRFSLYFPRSHQIATEAGTPEIVTVHNLKGSETLLVVDDEQAMVELAHEILIAQGYRVLTANDGEQALAVLERESVDLILFDVIMPRMDGYQLVAQVQQRYPHIKLQMVSGFADDRYNEMKDDELQRNILHKPYTSTELLACVRNLLDETAAEDKLAGCTVLVIDDEKDIRELYKLNLERLGCKTITASSGDDAIALYRKSLKNSKAIDAVILDLNLPGSIGGIEIADKIRIMDPGVKIVLSSGHSEGPEMSRYQDYGFQAVLEKNFDREKIKQVLVQVLSTDRQYDKSV